MRVAVPLEQCWHRVPGGTAHASLASVAAVAARGDVEQIGVAARHRAPPPAPWVPPIEVRHLPLPQRLLYTTWHWLRFPDVQGATGPVDLVHAMGMAIPPRVAPLVVTVHDLAFLHEPDHFTRWGRQFFAGFLRATQRDADLVLCPSEATRDDCLAHGFGADRLRVVPWGVDVAPATAAAREAVRRDHGLNRPYILWVGTAEPRKNLPGLLRAYRALGTADVDLVLAGPKGWKEDVEALVAPVRERVHVLGFLPRPELEALYAEAEVLCFPSLREGFGFPVIEAMAQGTPVVTSAGTSTEELVGDAGLVVDPRDPDAIAAALRTILDDPDLARRLGERGAVLAAECTWDRCADATVAAYREVLDGC